MVDKKEPRKRGKKAPALTVAQGLERLAFGGVADAVQLLLSAPGEYLPLSELDLFNVEAIKRTKDGCTEVKFYDRLRALQCLDALRPPTTDEGLYHAIEEGARALAASAGPQHHD